MTYGIKVGPETENVALSTDEHLQYSSEWNNWKIYKTDEDDPKSVSVPANGVGYVDITHDLGYVPVAEVWAVSGTLVYPVPGLRPTWGKELDIYIDSSKVRVYGRDLLDAGEAEVIALKYKIYYEKIV